MQSNVTFPKGMMPHDNIHKGTCRHLMHVAPTWRELITKCQRMLSYSPGVTIWFIFVLGHRSALGPDSVEDFGSPVESPHV